MIAALTVATLLAGIAAATAPGPGPQRPKYPEDLSKGRGKKRGVEAKGKLSPELAILFDQFVGSRSGEQRQYGSQL